MNGENASHRGHKIVNNAFNPLLKGCQSHWLHAMSRAKIARFDGVKRVQTLMHIDAAQHCLKALGLSQEWQTSGTSLE